MKQKAGAAITAISILSLMFVAGGMENMPPEAGFKECAVLFGAAIVSLGMFLFGLMLASE